ncbi:GRIP domain protein [Cooperia oncophora]
MAHHHAHERTLEDVLFGDEIAETVSHLGDDNGVKSVQELLEHNERLIKNLQHTRELLSDAEATNATLVAQSQLLKEEIRRLERNEERVSHIENSEYLKNVIIKFLCPERVSGERSQLVPILTTMLRLSPEETERLTRIAAQDGEFVVYCTRETSGYRVCADPLNLFRDRAVY